MKLQLRRTIFLLAALAVLCTGCNFQAPAVAPGANPTIAFGSCLRQWEPQPVWRGVTALKPDAFIFLGDNMYSDRGKYETQPQPQRIENAYNDLAATDDYQGFLRASQSNNTALFATWDDHDYGENDGGGDYPHKLAAKKYFQDFFGLPKTANGGADQPGIYQSHVRTVGNLQVQLLLLDTRSFRSPLKKSDDKAACPPTGTVANTDASATILGEQQWAWLAQELQKPADVRLLASSIQVIPDQHCFEKWANFPRERQRLFDLLRATAANGVIILSGDRHLGEISRLGAEAIGYPLYEITASGLNSAMGSFVPGQPEQNRYRLAAKNVLQDQFGSIELVGTENAQVLRLQLRATNGEVLQQAEVNLASLHRSP